MTRNPRLRHLEVLGAAAVSLALAHVSPPTLAGDTSGPPGPEKHAAVLAQVDAELGRALATIEGEPDAATAARLRDLREEANRIVLRITRALGDDYPCRETTLARPWPDWDEYVEFDVAPELFEMEAPHYPESARAARVEGVVLVRVLVDVDGRVKDARVVKGVAELDEAAVASVRTAVFEPARSKGASVPVWIVVPVEFALAKKE